MADGWEGAESHFRGKWHAAETIAKEHGQDINDFVKGVEPFLFDLFMRGVVNTIDKDFLLAILRNKQGVQNPYDFCVSGFAHLATRQGGGTTSVPCAANPEPVRER